MKCKNCGTENPDDLEYCKKCGKSFYLVKFNPYWSSIIVGIVAGFISLGIGYTFWGAGDTFFFGMIPSIIIAGCVGAIMAHNKNVDAGYDFNAPINGGIAGFIIGFIALIMVISTDPSQGYILLIFVPGYAFWGLIGGSIGSIVNIIREKDIRFVVPFAITIILICVVIGFSLNQNNTTARYDTSFDNQMLGLAFNDLMQGEANAFLNGTHENATNESSNLKEAQARFQRMIEITSYGLQWNQVMVKTASSDIETEYAKCLGQYLSLKKEYFTEMEAGIALAIKGDQEGAEIHYENAKRLIPKIEKQKESLTLIADKDPQFKDYVKEKLVGCEKYAEYKKQKSELMTSPFSGPTI